MEQEKDLGSLDTLLDDPSQVGEVIQPTFFLFNISQKGLERLIDYKMDINHLFVIHLLLKGMNPLEVKGLRVKSWIQGLIRKGYISSDGTSVTMAGRLLYSVIKGEKDVEKTDDTKTNWFNQWWEVYPKTNMFEYRGKLFPGGQKKNIKKGHCKEVFERMVNEEKYKAEDIVEATKYHIETIKKLSLQKGRNEMDYVPNSLRYLNETIFEPYIALYKKNKDRIEKTSTMDL